MTFLVVGILLLLGIAIIGMYNGFVKLRNRIEEAYATVEAYMKKRYDLIPNLVETVKGYAGHEKETLSRVVEARSRAMSAQGMQQVQQSEGELQRTLKSLFALSESYPDLKANASFLDLQAQLQRVEDDILQARKYYNAIVKNYNIKVEVIPQSIIAALFGFKKREYWEVEDAAHEVVQVKF